MKKIILCVLLLLFLPLVSAVKLGASNSKLEFNLSVNEEGCRRIGIGTDYLGDIVIELKFAKDSLGDKKVSDYNLDPSYLKINSNYTKEINFKNPGNKETVLCLSGKNTGNYKGLLVYKTKSSNAALGVIINLNIREDYNKTEIGLFLTPSIFLSVLLLILLIRGIN